MSRKDYIFKPFEQEQEYMEQRVQEGIEGCRKGNGVVKVCRKDGTPVSDVRLQVKQTRHRFLHGANLFMLDEMESEAKNAQYKKDFAQVFNLATLPFYWADLEPVQDKPRYTKDSPKVYRRPTPDLCLEYCEKTGITPKLHCLNYDQWTPTWVPQHDVPAIKALLEKRFREIGERYAHKIPGIEVINETLLRPVFAETRRSTDFFWADDLIPWSFQTARKYFPGNQLIINEATLTAWDTHAMQRSNYPMVIEQAMAQGAAIDAIGLQYHLFHRLEHEERETCPLLSPRMLYAAMDFYQARFGKPLQVTEITIPAYSASAEDEEIQAQLLDNLYSIWFSHPAMEAAIYWNLVDGYAAFAPQGDMTSGENYFYGGLVRFDMRKKPAYDRLEELFRHRWNTRCTLTADAHGVAAFRGFLGDYEITVEKNGHAFTQTARLEKGETALQIVLDD